MTWEAKKERQLARKATVGHRKAPIAAPTPVPAPPVSDDDLERLTAPPPSAPVATPPAKPGKR